MFKTTALITNRWGEEERGEAVKGRAVSSHPLTSLNTPPCHALPVSEWTNSDSKVGENFTLLERLRSKWGHRRFSPPNESKNVAISKNRSDDKCDRGHRATSPSVSHALVLAHRLEFKVTVNQKMLLENSRGLEVCIHLHINTVYWVRILQQNPPWWFVEPVFLSFVGKY